MAYFRRMSSSDLLVALAHHGSPAFRGWKYASDGVLEGVVGQAGGHKQNLQKMEGVLRRGSPSNGCS